MKMKTAKNRRFRKQTRRNTNALKVFLPIVKTVCPGYPATAYRDCADKLNRVIEDKVRIKADDIDIMRVQMRNLQHIFPSNITGRKEKVILGKLNKEFSFMLPTGTMFRLPKGTVTMATEAPSLQGAVLIGVDRTTRQPLSWKTFLEQVNVMKRKPNLTSAEKDLIEVHFLLEPVFD